jgi:tRNA dimethylallyltransferase
MYIEAVLKGYKMVAVPENKELRKKLEHKTLAELTALLQTYKALHNTTDVDTAKRAVRAIEIAEFYRTLSPDYTDFPPINSLIIGIDISREERRARITDRLHRRLREGMIEEVEQILKSGVSPEDLIYYGLEYKFVTLYLTGKLDYNQMVIQLETAIHQFAKRQMTWFRGMETRGLVIHWIDGLLSTDEKIKQVKRIIE